MEISEITKDKANEMEYVNIKVGNIEIRVYEFTTDPNLITVVSSDWNVPIAMHVNECDQGLSYMPSVTFHECEESDKKFTISLK